MHRVEPPAPPEAARGRARGRLGPVAALLALAMLVACQSAPGPQAEAFDLEQLASFDLPVNEAHRVRFLPPLGHPDRNADYVAGLDLEFAIFNVDPASGEAYGAPLGPDLAVASVGSGSWRDAYSLTWDLPDTMSSADATAYLRLEIRLPGAGDAAVCGGTSAPCLGYLDVFAYRTGRERQQAPEGFVPVPAQGTFPLSFLILEGGNPVPDSIADLDTLSGGRFDVTAGSCPSSDFSRPGQGLQAVGAGLQAVGAGLQAVGAVGGLFSAPSDSFAGSLAEPADVAATLAANLEGAPGKDAVLLVVDDFGGKYELPSELFEEDADLDAIFASGELSHGALVLAHLLRMAPTLLGVGVHLDGLNDETGDPYYVFGNYHSRKLYVQVVDAAGLNTEGMADRISAALDDQTINHHGGATVVVNMSFAIVPCAVLGDYSTAGLETFEQYVAALAVVNGIGSSYLDELGRLVASPVELSDDPLLSYLECPFPSAHGTRCDGADGDGDHGKVWWMTHVAASGNYGNAYALYPSAARMVVSVGAPDILGEAYSNAAEILAPGGFYHLATSGERTIAYAGTSFAAPLVSLFLAVDLMHHPDDRCQPSDLTTNPPAPPPLATGNYEMLPFAPEFAASGSNALDLYCPRPY